MNKSLILGLIIVCLVSAAFAVPLRTNYQAKVTDTTGTPITGTRNIVFRIYDSETGGALVWSESHASVNLSDGFFAVTLGETNPLDFDFSDTYYLEVQIGSDTLSPREPFASVLYALWAQNADKIGGYDMGDWAWFADSLKNYFTERGYDYPFDTLLSWIQVQDSMRSILWNGCPTEDYLYEWMLVFNEFCDRGWDYDTISNYLDYIGAAGEVFDSLGSMYDISIDDIYNSVMLWSVMYEAMDTFFTRTGWTADSVFLYLDDALDAYDTLSAYWESSGWTMDTIYAFIEIFDSLRSLDIDSLVNAYITDFDVDSVINEFLTTFDYDSFVTYWIDSMGYGDLYDSLLARWDSSGWTEDSVLYYMNMADSLLALDVDSLLDWYIDSLMTEYGIDSLLAIDYDSVINYYTDSLVDYYNIDSLLSIDFDSLANWYIDSLIAEYPVEIIGVPNGFGVTVGADTTLMAWFDNVAGKFYGTFKGDTVELDWSEVPGGYLLSFEGDTVAYFIYDESTASIAVYAFGDTIGYLDVNVDMDGAAIEFNGDTLYYADFSNPATAIGAAGLGMALGFVDLVNTPDGYRFVYESDTLVWVTFDDADYRALVYTQTDTFADLDMERIPGGAAMLFNGDTLAKMHVETTGDTTRLFLNNNEVGIAELINDADGFGVWSDLTDTLFYLNYDSLMMNILGFTDIDSFINYYIDSLVDEYGIDSLLSIDFDSLITYYTDSLADYYNLDSLLAFDFDSMLAYYSDSLLAEFMDSLDVYHDDLIGEMVDSLNAYHDELIGEYIDTIEAYHLDTLKALWENTDIGWAASGDSIGIYAEGPIAGYFDGDVVVTGKVLTDTIFNPDGDTLYINDKVWVDELVTDSIEARGDVVKIRDALFVQDSLYFDGAWHTAWPAGGGSSLWADSTTFLMVDGQKGIFGYGNVGLGDHDSTHVNLGVACTTGTSGEDNKYCTVGGGYQNTASSQIATVGGGYQNTASSQIATVGGGYQNTASGDGSTVGGGWENIASGLFSAIPGGYADTVSGDHSFAFGRSVSVSSDYYAVFFDDTYPGRMGINNETPASALDVGGDIRASGLVIVDTIQSPLDTLYINDKVWVDELVTDSIEARGDVVKIRDALFVQDSLYFDGAWHTSWPAAAVCNWADSTTFLMVDGQKGIFGYGNVGLGDHDSTHVNLGVACTTGTSGEDNKYCTISGGYHNTSVDYATVGGGDENTAGGMDATIGGGWANAASEYASTIGGGYQNAASGDASTIGGGGENTASSDYATVGGGASNIASVDYATVGGGYYNEASGFYTTVGGGYANIASSDYTTVGGGYYNEASGDYTTLGGGKNNEASGYSATVGGGYLNNVSGMYSTIPGGYADTVSGDYSFAFGRSVSVSSNYYAVFFDDTYPGRMGINNETPTSALDVGGDIEVGSDDAFYFGDPTTDGTWRIIRSGTDLVIELRVSGAWVTKLAITP